MSQPQFAQSGAKEFHLEFPQSIGVFDKYEEAQKAVDYLADEQFPVQNLAIVGTDLKQYERVMGRRTWSNVLLNGALGGIMNGLFISIIMLLLVPNVSLPTALLYGILLGVIFGVIVSAIGYAMSGRNRDFNSITHVFANKYEVLCEHRVANQAREKLANMPGYRATILAGQQYYPAPPPAAASPSQPVDNPQFPNNPYAQAQAIQQHNPETPAGLNQPPQQASTTNPYTGQEFDPRPNQDSK